MSKKMLGFALFILNLSVVLVPVVLAFSTNGWNPREAVMPPEENIQELQERVSNFTEEGDIREVDREIDPQSGGMNLTLKASSPFERKVYLEELSGDMYMGERKVCELSLVEEKVVLKEDESTSFVLGGSLKEDPETLARRGNLDRQVENVSVEMEVLDLEVTAEDLEVGNEYV
ncbi:MAG: hypothetical protein ACLFTY_01615 [Candidatus Aenigmatarchaeota archaeon]